MHNEPSKKTQVYILANSRNYYNWTETFAWFPVTTISGKKIWWKKVFKRRVWIETEFTGEPVVQYGTWVDVIKESKNGCFN